MFLQQSDSCENRINNSSTETKALLRKSFLTRRETCNSIYCSSCHYVHWLTTHSGHRSQHYSKSALRHFFLYSILWTEHWTMSDTCTQEPHRLVPSYFHSLWLAYKSEDLTKKIMVWNVLLWLTYCKPKTGKGRGKSTSKADWNVSLAQHTSTNSSYFQKKFFHPFSQISVVKRGPLLITPWGFFSLCYPIPHSHLRHQDRWKQNRGAVLSLVFRL